MVGKFVTDQLGRVGFYAATVKDDLFVVGQVQAGSPADRAGVRTGDVITRIEGAPYSAGKMGPDFFGSRRGPVGSTFRITVRRNGKEHDIAMRRQRLPDPARVSFAPAAGGGFSLVVEVPTHEGFRRAQESVFTPAR